MNRRAVKQWLVTYGIPAFNLYKENIEQEPTLQEQLDKARADWDKAQVDWRKADADLDKAYADRRKAKAALECIEKLMDKPND